MNEDFNMTMRKFLKQVGVTSQQAIEEAVRGAADNNAKSYDVRMVLTIGDLNFEHVVEGKITGPSA